MASDYVSGGYYLTPNLIPDRVLSASSCLCEFFPGAWAIEWTTDSGEERAKRAAAFGISPIDLPSVIAWATSALSKAFGWPNVFYTLEAAQEARRRFLAYDSATVIFGLGLHNSDVEAFLEAAAPPPQTPGCAPMGETGIFECVQARKLIAGGGDCVGFELLATFLGILTESWMCEGLEKDCASYLNVVTNRKGFVSTYHEAQRCAEFISRKENRLPPDLWLPWLVTVYPEKGPITCSSSTALL